MRSSTPTGRSSSARTRGEKKPATAEVTDLAEGEQFTIDQDSDVPTIAGGTWALGGDTLAHATLGPDGGYCVATVDLASRGRPRSPGAPSPSTASTPPTSPLPAPPCSPSTTPSPSCRTVGTVAGRRVRPVPRRARVRGLGGGGARRRRGHLVGDPERGRPRRRRSSSPAPARTTTTSAPARRARSCRARTRRTSSATRSSRATRPSCCAGTAAAWRSSTRRRPASRSWTRLAAATPRSCVTALSEGGDEQVMAALG